MAMWSPDLANPDSRLNGLTTFLSFMKGFTFEENNTPVTRDTRLLKAHQVRGKINENNKYLSFYFVVVKFANFV